MSDINDAINSFGGTWVKLRSKADGVLEGTVQSAEVREKSFEGAPVLNRKTGKPRTEWVITLKVETDEPDDDGTRKFAANESAQRAIATAVKESGKKLEEGSKLKLAVIEDPADSRSQAVYKAKHEGASQVQVPAAADPWGSDDAEAPF